MAASADDAQTAHGRDARIDVGDIDGPFRQGEERLLEGRFFAINCSRVIGPPRTRGSPRNRCQRRNRCRCGARASRQKRFPTAVFGSSRALRKLRVPQALLGVFALPSLESRDTPHAVRRLDQFVQSPVVLRFESTSLGRGFGSANSRGPSRPNKPAIIGLRAALWARLPAGTCRGGHQPPGGSDRGRRYSRHRSPQYPEAQRAPCWKATIPVA